MTDEFKQPNLAAADQEHAAGAKVTALRDDGPTLEEYVKAGYDPATYPPEGYAAKEPPRKWGDRPQNAVAAVNTGKKDELSQAVLAARSPAPVEGLAPVKHIPKYALEYVLDGEQIRETHASLRQALAGVDRLRRLGITPSTSTL